ncbi:MAG: sigma-70 family RNA polymerase sigma factor [Microcella sp.]|uniref:RNA polymerase sigma factor n=1 Tax=Microcella sp. TaxID=1913979 RepID=UPI0033153CF4
MIEDEQGDAIAAALTTLAREDRGRVVALLARRFGDLDLVDDAVQDALVEALEHWKLGGIPDNPAAWLLTTARNRAIDRLRRNASAHRRTISAAPELVAEQDPSADVELMITDHGEVVDERLRLILLCCHPALEIDTQVALTLRLVGGLTTHEIASAFLLPEPTLAQRIVRGKRKISSARIPLSIPRNIEDRIEAVLNVLYLVFNEGYLSRGDRIMPLRIDLMDEAIRLTRVVSNLAPSNPEVLGLLSLELFTAARQASRLSPAGDLVLLEQQDRSLWDRDMIHEANNLVTLAISHMKPGQFQVQAIIAWHHANSASAADTRWGDIARLYGHLQHMTPSPLATLNQAVAVSKIEGAQAGLDLVDGIQGLEKYHLFHATRGEFLLQIGDREEARSAFRAATEHTRSPSELAHLGRRIAATEGE